MCRKLGWTLRTYLYGGWFATSGKGVRMNWKLPKASSASALDGVRSRVITYRLMTLPTGTSKVARRQTDPTGRFILQTPISNQLGFSFADSRRLQRLCGGRCTRNGCADRLDDSQRRKCRRGECEIQQLSVRQPQRRELADLFIANRV